MYVLIGNYGSGKSELALNFAFEAAKHGRTELIDLDMVNTYFRLTERGKMVSQKEIRLVSPNFACSGIETLSLPAEVQSAFALDWDTVVFDVGGDAVGSTALGRYHSDFMELGPDQLEVLNVVNIRRPLAGTVEKIARLQEEMQIHSRLKITGMINNTNLANMTTPAELRDGYEMLREVSDLTGIPVAYTAGTKDLLEQFLAEKGIGRKGIQYKMKDWAFNRQRYWGEPIPLIHCPKCGVVGVPYEELPLRLPDVEDFEPGEDGQSPLAKIDSFVNCTCPKCGGPAKRETDTMPQWAGSSWYFLRYVDANNDKVFADRKKIDYWMPVDWYNGGMEHVTRHLIYSRFWHHFLYDIGEVNTSEPYMKRSAQGLILGPDGDKMSKSKGNVVDPLDIVEQYGADTLRVYVLFMGDYASAAPWSDSSVKGCRRFLERVAGLTEILTDGASPRELETVMHKTIKKVSEDIEAQKFNTAIAALMTLLNDIYKAGSISKADLITFLKLLSPFAPHLTEELYESVREDGAEEYLTVSAWPTFDPAKTVDDLIEVGVQVNGKVRAAVQIARDADKDTALAAARANERVASFIEGKTLIKEIFVPGKIINFVVK